MPKIWFSSVPIAAERSTWGVSARIPPKPTRPAATAAVWLALVEKDARPQNSQTLLALMRTFCGNGDR